MHICQDEVAGRFFQLPERLEPVLCEDHLVAGPLQADADKFSDHLVVVDDEDSGTGGHRFHPTWSATSPGRLSGSNGLASTTVVGAAVAVFGLGAKAMAVLRNGPRSDTLIQAMNDEPPVERQFSAASTRKASNWNDEEARTMQQHRDRAAQAYAGRAGQCWAHCPLITANSPAT